MDDKPPIGTAFIITAILGGIMLFAAIGANTTHSVHESADKRTEIERKLAIKSFTKDMYSRTLEGMTYKEVVQVMGEDGDEISSTTTALSTNNLLVTKCYKWQNEDGSNIITTFQNDMLVSKAQAGL